MVRVAVWFVTGVGGRHDAGEGVAAVGQCVWFFLVVHKCVLYRVWGVWVARGLKRLSARGLWLWERAERERERETRGSRAGGASLIKAFGDGNIERDGLCLCEGTGCGPE